MTDLGTLEGRLYSQAAAINASGQVVGSSDVVGGFGVAAFLYAGGTMTDLNSLINPSLNWNLLTAGGINDDGQIVGVGDVGGEYHAFLLTPTVVPEPSTGLIALGLVSTLMLRRRKKAGAVTVEKPRRHHSRRRSSHR